MIIDCIGCLHGAKRKMEGGDLLIVTGDLTARHTPIETVAFLHWLSEQKYRKIIWIAGNHDTQLVEEKDYKVFFDGKVFDIQWPAHFEYLCDSGTEFEGLKIWGSPWSLRFPGINPKCTAFTGSEDEIYNYYEKIPSDTDILITHQPPFGILDGIPIRDGSLYHAGSHKLYGWLEYVGRPRLHVFSHIHEGYGQTEYFPAHDDKMMISVNCSIMNAKYRPVNNPIRIIL
jgi:Icc-related predicted phosphoesterase